jgi:hypothetical protein
VLANKPHEEHTEAGGVRSISAVSGNAPAYFRAQFHQPEDRSAIRVRLILLSLPGRRSPAA